MKNALFIILLMAVCFSTKAQSSFTVVNNTITSICQMNVSISYYSRDCSLITSSNTVTIPNGSSTTINLSSLSWGPITPNPLWMPTFTVYYINSNGAACNTPKSVGGLCHPSQDILTMCHPFCQPATATYNSSTATLSVDY